MRKANIEVEEQWLVKLAFLNTHNTGFCKPVFMHVLLQVIPSFLSIQQGLHSCKMAQVRDIGLLGCL